ncbi:MAG: DNA-3-methyladenine glycosylase [Lysobacteraceae bacterium]|nr:MAG: DNA-3-methyladenine glycosylase [Xanthomonadaceae bacterium]
MKRSPQALSDTGARGDSQPFVARARPLPRGFFARMPAEVAPELLGKLIRRDDGRLARVVEVEAYAQDDPAAHTFRGMTARNRSMFGPPGHWYVYFSYGVHWCANLVCGPEGYGAGVLLRAAEPLEGIGLMRQARGREPLRELCSGPGRLAQAFGIERALDGSDAIGSGVLTVLADGGPPPPVLACARVGISKNAGAPLRFVVAGSPHLSRPVPQALSTPVPPVGEG